MQLDRPRLVRADDYEIALVNRTADACPGIFWRHDVVAGYGDDELQWTRLKYAAPLHGVVADLFSNGRVLSAVEEHVGKLRVARRAIAKIFQDSRCLDQLVLAQRSHEHLLELDLTILERHIELGLAQCNAEL